MTFWPDLAALEENKTQEREAKIQRAMKANGWGRHYAQHQVDAAFGREMERFESENCLNAKWARILLDQARQPDTLVVE